MWGGPLLLYLPGEESPHKEFLGWDPNRGIFRGISLGLCAFFALDDGAEVSNKTKGPGEEGAPRNHPEILSQKVADSECRFPYDSYGKNRALFWPCLGEGFWSNIRWPLLLPASLFYR